MQLVMGEANGYDVAKTMPVRIIPYPDLNLSRGPTTLKAYFSSLSVITSRSERGAVEDYSCYTLALSTGINKGCTSADSLGHVKALEIMLQVVPIPKCPEFECASCNTRF